MFNLSEHVALVTGGNSGIGLAYAKGLVQSGAQVAIWGRNEEKNVAAEKELRALGGDVKSFVCDVTDKSQIAEAFNSTIGQFGKVDSCFANAGGGGFRGLGHQIDRETWSSAIDLNVISVIDTFAPVIEHQLERKQGGKLVVTSSITALMGSPTAAPYSMTKSAVCALVRSLAVELGRAGIQVNAVLPGFIETEMSKNIGDEARKATMRRSAIGRLGELSDMEGVAVFLASRHSDFITGQNIVMDGGHTIHPM